MTALPNHTDDHDRTSATLDHLDGLLEALEPSSDPAIVFTSLVGACVPAFSDECSVEIVADGGASHRLVRPHPQADLAVRGARSGSPIRVNLEFDGAAHGADSFRGVFECTWHQRNDIAIDAVIMRILVGRAVSLVAEARLAEQARSAETAAANLRIALASSRVIGNAVGILMVAYKINAAAAFELLRDLSQRSNRKVVDMAADVVETGCLDHT